MTYSVYDLATGAILRHGLQYDPELNCGPGEGWIEGNWPDDQYVMNLKTGRANKRQDKPLILAADVKQEAARRLGETDWLVARAAEDPEKPVPADMLARRKAIRTASNKIEAKSPIPQDYRNDRHWPA
jgi:hypothetical protein